MTRTAGWRFFYVVTTACVLASAGIAVPRPAFATSLASCTVLGTNMFQISEGPEGSADVTAGVKCKIPDTSSPINNFFVDLLEPGLTVNDHNPVSDYLNITGLGNNPKNEVTLISDPGSEVSHPLRGNVDLITSEVIFRGGGDGATITFTNESSSMTTIVVISDVSPVPEPSTLLLLGTALVGIPGLRRLTRKVGLG